MSCCGQCISPCVDGKVGSHLILGFCSISGQANSSETSSGKRQVSQEAGFSCVFRASLQKIYNWSQGLASPLWAIVSFPVIKKGPTRKGHRSSGANRGDGEWRREWIWGTESHWRAVANQCPA